MGLLFTTSLIIIAAVCFIYYFIYFGRRLLNPFKQSDDVPGPFPLPIIGTPMFFRGKPDDILRKLKELYETYPRTFKVWLGTQQIYCISDAKKIEALDKHTTFVNTGLSEQDKPLCGRSYTGYKWKDNIGLMQELDKDVLNSVVDIFSEKAYELMLILEPYAQCEALVPDEIFHNASLDMVFATALGNDTSSKSLQERFRRDSQRLTQLIILKNFTTFYRWKWLFNMIYAKGFEACLGSLNEFTEKVIHKKRIDLEKKIETGDEPKKKVFLDYFFDTANRPNVTTEELRDEISAFIIAANDNNLTTECFVMIMLGLYPDIQKKVYDEVCNLIGPFQDIEAKELPNLEYTEMVIKETLRFFNTIPFIINKVKADITLEDQIFIPKGSEIWLATFRNNFSTEYWTNPNDFNPDRFQSQEVKKQDPFANISFSFGLGRRFDHQYALMATKIVIATLIRKYKFSTEYENIEEVASGYNFTSPPRNGYKIRLQNRDL